MGRLFFDSETCGLHGMPVLFQYALDDGEIVLYDLWKHPIGETLDLIEWFLTHEMVFFNAVFDMFHLVKTYTIFRLCPRDWIPEDHIDEIAMREPEAQDGPAIKPAHTLDLMLHSRKGAYQSLMAREDIRIRRVPTALAYALAQVLEEKIEIDGIYFAKSHDKDAPRWNVFDVKDKEGNISKDFKDVCLRFNAAGGLKFLAEYALGYAPKYHFEDVELDRKKYGPKELGYSPTALSISTPEKRWEVYRTNKKTKQKEIIGYAWPGLIKHHIKHWAENGPAREYACDDIKYTRELYTHFGCPPCDDDDSVLACMVPVVRWHGFQINVEGIKELRVKAQVVIDASPININKHKDVRTYIGQCLDDMEKVAIATSTNKKNLEKIRDLPEWDIEQDEPCTKCDGVGKHEHGHCHRCNGTGEVKKGRHPAALRAEEILLVKNAVKEVELYTKLLRAGKFHASFVVVGTLSSRMSGGDGLNAQGIKGTKEVRSMFPLLWEMLVQENGGDPELIQYVLSGGDFDSFEVTLADAVYEDPDLRKALITKVPCHKCNGVGHKTKCKEKGCKGRGCELCDGKPREIECDECDGTGKTTKKLHALFAMCLFPGFTYEQIVASAGTANDMYAKGKSAVFAMIYGGDFNTLVRNISVSVEVARAAFDTWNKWFPKSAKARERTFKKFCSMTQPGGIGTAVIWADPEEYVESFIGFRRYFTLENMITKALFDLSRSVPKEWRECKVKVLRRDRVQTAGGAVSSALYGAAFQIQAANQRAAANHEIQSPGGSVTKSVQRRIWDLQPVGVNPLYVAPMNIHDEIMCVNHPVYTERVAEVVRKRVEEYRELVPLIGMTWNLQQANWAEKKGGSVTLKIRPPELDANYQTAV